MPHNVQVAAILATQRCSLHMYQGWHSTPNSG